MRTTSNLRTVSVKSSESYINKRLTIACLSIPLMTYGFVSSFNNIFGVDLVFGLMGERDPVGAGYTIVFGMPIYMYALITIAIDKVKGNVKHLIINDNKIEIYRPLRVSVPSDKIEETKIIIKNHTEYFTTKILEGKEIKIKMSHLDIGKTELELALTKLGYNFN